MAIKYQLARGNISIGIWLLVLNSDHVSLIDFNPSYASEVIFRKFMAYFGTQIWVFPGFLKSVDSKTACSPDQVT